MALDEALGEVSNRTDVLIIGAGPTGLMMALWMSQLGIKSRIIDKCGTRTFSGHADGLQIRTMEILDSFGISNMILQQSASFLDFCNWTPNEDGTIKRGDISSHLRQGLSRFEAQTLHQGHIESHVIDAIRDRSDIKVERGMLPTSLKFDKSQAEDPKAYPITVELKHLREDEIEPDQFKSHRVDKNGIKPELNMFRNSLRRGDADVVYKTSGKEGTTETVHAKYMLGCEGAHSWTRRQLGFKMEGENTDVVWGVMDIIPVTDFPDIRKLCIIQSKKGSMLIIPRENQLSRLYVQLREVGQGANAEEDLNMTPEKILNAARRILAPYNIRYTYCDWWTAYQVGQRVGNHYTESERIFLAGDAVHTHTPKAGQGMNISMQDAFNLGWKLGGVVKGQLPRSILKSYELERRPIAQFLIAFDQKLSQIYARQPDKDELQKMYLEQSSFMSGLSVRYEPGLLIAESEQSPKKLYMANGTGSEVIAKEHLATNISLGMRLPSYQVLCQAEARLWQTQALLKSDGRWRLIIFGGDISDKAQMNRLNILGDKLATPTTGILNKYTPKHNHNPAESPCPIQLLLLHSADRHGSELSDFHPTFFPFDEEYGHDYNIVFADAPATNDKPAGDAHGFYGVDAARGCLVVTRPDQYVGYIGALEDTEDLGRYFDGILVAQK